MDRLSAESLRWTLGPYCAFVGAFMLVAPHRFTAPVYAALVDYRELWGMSALVAGVALLAVAILRPRRAVVLLGQGLAGATLLALSASFLQNRAWTGMIAYGVLGVGTMLAGTLPRASSAGRDLFALLMGLIAVLQGLLLAGLPSLLGSSYFDVIRPYQRVIGLALILGGGLVLSAHLRRNPSALYVWAAHLAGGAAFFLFGLLFSLPNRAWTGLALYWGCGLAVALLPWLSRELAALDPASLRTRLAFSLATATSVALVLTAAVATSQEERLATEQVLEMRKVEAQLIARNVADYVQLNGARAAVVATLAGRIPMTPVFQRALLEASRPSYPDVTGFLTLDAAGTVLAAIGKVPLDVSDWRRLAVETAADLQSQERSGSIPIRLAGTERLLLLLSAPIRLEDGTMGGVLVSAFDAELLARRLARTGSNVYLADGYGRLIASRQDTDVELQSLPAGWDRELLRGQVPAMARRIAAFARVPGGLDWVVAVERPRAAALAGVRRGRDLAFLLLLIVVPLAVIGGIIVAGLIARPLGVLAEAVDEMASGNPALPAIPLESSGITEVASLAAAFQEMRGRLAVRTRESERLATELRARADALAETDRRKDEFLAMLAHELRNPLGAIANAAHVMDQIGTTQPPLPPVQRAVGVIQRQIQHLVRLVDDLLDVSRITRGKIELRLEPVDLRDAVRSAVEMTRPIVEAKEHALRVELPPEPLSVHADVTRLEQVLGNLVRNAAKYTEPGGKIEVTAWSEGREAVVRVRDNGIGIPPELLPRIFDLFIQGEQSLDRSGGGLGIGLTLVYRLVEMHGGQVAAQSGGEGQGSEFTVRLPLTPL